MALASPAAKRSRKPYVYERLYDLSLQSRPVNVMGVIVLFRPPYMSKGSDFTCTMEIIDEGSESSPTPLIFFNRDRRKLPQSCNIGDVICVRGVAIGEFNNRLQGKCRNMSTWLVWDGQKDGRRAPAAASDGASWDTDEMDRACTLIRWSTSDRTVDSQPSVSHQLSPVMQPPRTTSAMLSIVDLTLTNQKTNFVGIIKSVSIPQKSKGPDYFISVTLIDESSPADGLVFTFFNPVENHLPKFGDPGSAAYLMNIKIVEYEGDLLGRGHQRSRVVCFSMQPDGEMRSSLINSDVPTAVTERARALLDWVATAQPQLNIVEDSQLDSEYQNFPSHAPPPTDLLSSTEKSTESNFMPPIFLTLMLHPTWEVSSLKDTETFERVPSRFRVRVKVLQVLQPLRECCQLRCPECKYKFPLEMAGRECDKCMSRDETGAPKLRFMYCLSLLVGDDSATCKVHLSDTDADEFFRDLLPANLNESHNTRESLLKVLRRLSGRLDPFLPPESSFWADKTRPWIDCCVLTYPSCKGTQLRIVDTWFTG